MADTLEDFIKRNCHYNGMGKVGRYYWETRGLDLTDIAKRIRKDIKNSIKNGRLYPDVKYSVRISRGSMLYQKITIEVKGTVPEEKSWRWRVVEQLKFIVSSYNYDFSDSMHDYHRSRFYTTIEVNNRQW
jgi:CRISPR/Cas system-associated exonuclease Cas4 (RecB family)